MINKKTLLMLLLFLIVFASSISVISAANSNADDAQIIADEEIVLKQSNSDVQKVADAETELEQSDSNQDDLSKYGGLDDTIQNEDDKVSTKIVADNITTVPGEGIIVAKLTDDAGTPLEGYNLTLDVLDTSIKRNFVTNGSGEVFFDLERPVLDVGNYTGVIKFWGKDNYNESTLNINIEVRRFNTNITADNLTFILGESGNLTVLLTDFNGKPIENATLKLDVSPIHEVLKTNASGEAVFDFGILDAGTYEGNIKFEDTYRYINSSIPIKVTINRIPTEIIASNVTYTYGEKKYLLVTFKDKYGNPITNETIVFKVNGIPVYNKTDDNGQTEFLLDLAPASYNATVSFAGNKTHELNSYDVVIVVEDIKEKISINKYNFDSVYNEGKYLTATLNDESGKGIANKEFVVKLNGKTRKYATDANGQIKVPISSLVPKTYAATITFMGDKKYESVSFDIKLVVKKAKPYIFASKKKFNVKTYVKKYKVTLKNKRNAPIKKVNVYLKVKGKTYMVKTNKKGQAIFKLKKLTKKGTYKAIITFKGDKYYKKAVKNAKIKVW
ncbi:hypothetical protein [Methanobrevibacter sp.]|uniref:hypothetical protein n=1 Tax=Methanobrevibacter sp. TaxID=66852 RepID=UPI00386AA8CB